ncbi:protein of unknown function [Paenibacillus alvei]|uniref:Uncharacterized protein n=1 Tax=Paenibacillus alvei TaxID=44250 RepID=A0A383R7T4_PAEAL|nr:protein of unknown function [Paenibacillus alvei]
MSVPSSIPVNVGDTHILGRYAGCHNIFHDYTFECVMIKDTCLNWGDLTLWRGVNTL